MLDTDLVPPVSRTRSKRTPYKLNPRKVLELDRQGYSHPQIAKQQGVATSTVYRFLERQKPEQRALERFKTHRADELAGLQAKAIGTQHLLIDSIIKDLEVDGVSRSLSPATKANLLNALNNVQGTVYDKERLERGESTQNISLMSRMLDASVKSLHKRNALISKQSSLVVESDS